MKKHLIIVLSLLIGQVLFGQVTNGQNVDLIEVDGQAKIAIKPDFYNLTIMIQEVDQKVNNVTIGKTSIDSIKSLLITALKKYEINEKDLKSVGIFSKENYTGSFGQMLPLTQLVYSFKTSDKEKVQKIVNELRFTGLKSILVNYTINNDTKNAIKDTLYQLALADAQKNAAMLASKINKTIGGVKHIASYPLDMISIEKELMSFELFNNPRIEYDSRDQYAKYNLRVTYELK